MIKRKSNGVQQPVRVQSAVVLLLIVFLLSNCKDKTFEEPPLARVYDSYLFFRDIQDQLPESLTGTDSTVFVQNLIVNWGREQLMINKALFNLEEKNEDIEALVSKYRNDLMKFAYQQAYLNQNLDTAITTEQIASYYEENSYNFELKENILRATYFVVPTGTPQLIDIRRKFKSQKEKDWEDVMQYATVFATEISLEDTTWLSYSELAKILPIENYNPVDFLRRNKLLILEDEDQVYFLRIEEYKFKESVSPLEYVSETIRNILLNKRKLETIQKMEKKLVEDAYEKKAFEIY